MHYDSYSQSGIKPSQSAMTAAAISYRQEQLRIAAQAAEMNPELTGARPAFMITKEQREKLMTSLIPLLFFDGRVYFCTVGQISAVRERDRGVVLSSRINLQTKDGQPPVLCLPSNISFSEFVQKWAPNFAVLYGDPQSLSDQEISKRGGGTKTPKGKESQTGVGNLKFSKVAVNPDRVVGIYPEDGWCTVIEVEGPNFEQKNTSTGFFSRGDNTGSSNLLASCTSITNIKIATQIGDALRKLRPECFDDIVQIIGNRDVGFGKRII